LFLGGGRTPGPADAFLCFTDAFLRTTFLNVAFFVAVFLVSDFFETFFEIVFLLALREAFLLAILDICRPRKKNLAATQTPVYFYLFVF
jgi:hypothetical protein